MKLSLIIPFYNEKLNVNPLIKEAFEALKHLDCFEIVAVDDASEDNTLTQLSTVKLTYSNLRVIKHKVKVKAGQSAAIITGVKCAQYNWIATIDGDGQSPPDEINRLIKNYQQHQIETLYIGNRQQRNGSLIKVISSRIENTVRQYFLHDNCPDSGCGLKLFPRDALLNAPFFDHCHRFMPAIFAITDKTTINVPVSHRARKTGISKYDTLDRTLAGIYDLFGVAWLRKCYIKESKGREV